MKEIVRAFNGHEVRVIIQKGVEWFIAKDVCEVLELAQHRRAVAETVERLNKAGLDGKGVTASIPLKTIGGTQNFLCVNEQGVYELIFSSKKEEAVRFRAWVTSEVLPSIRKTGKYEIPKEMKERSTENRNLLTGQWKRQGVSKPVEYGSLTKESYRQIFSNSDLRKASMDRGQILKLAAFESVEAWKLSENPENALGFSGCRESITETAGLLEAVRNQNLLRAAQV
jgi:prophage antirepressor-like protein